MISRTNLLLATLAILLVVPASLLAAARNSTSDYARTGVPFVSNAGQAGGERISVDAAYIVEGSEYGFAVGEHNRSTTLVIAPLLASTFLGGSGKDGTIETPMVMDAQGNVFVASRTRSTDFPVIPGCYDDDEHNGGANDVFVAKFSADLSILLAATYLGGTGEDGTWPGVALAIDADDNIYVAGRTFSGDFPHTYGSLGGTSDAFIAKLDNNLETLLVSRLLGGAAGEYFLQLAFDNESNLFVSGTTASATTFPITAGVYQPDYGGGGGGPYPGDLFVCKYTSDLCTLLASTFLGGSVCEYCEELLVDDQGNVYLAGWTSSDNYPTSEGAYCRTHHGGIYEAFVSILSNDLTTLVASTLIGYTGWDFAYAMALDADGNVYITGHTASNPFPTTADAFDRYYNGIGSDGDDVFVSKLDGTLQNLLASTYLGSSKWEHGTCLVVRESGDVLVAGPTRSPNFPVTYYSYDPFYNGSADIFVALLTSELTSRQTATFLGGSDRDWPCRMIINSSGDLCLSGITISSDYPVLETSYDDSFNGAGGDWLQNDGSTFGGDVLVTILPGGYFVDTDLDGAWDANDNCPEVPNSLQEDADLDGTGDACDACTDTDDDGFGNPGFAANTCDPDNCPDDYNPGQGDSDQDGIGDVCDICHGFDDTVDNDGDTVPDGCDDCPGFDDRIDPDEDGVPSDCDNCPEHANPDQADHNNDQIGDVCCCIDRVGDANGSGDYEPTIGDITAMIDAKFITGTCDGVIGCLTEADTNQSGGLYATCADITIGDIALLIDYLFVTGSDNMDLPECP